MSGKNPVIFIILTTTRYYYYYYYYFYYYYYYYYFTCILRKIRYYIIPKLAFCLKTALQTMFSL